MIDFRVITLFPDSLDSYLKASIIRRAVEDGKISVKAYNPRDFAGGKRRRVDRRPYGGGPGMVIEALPVMRAIEKALKQGKSVGERKAAGKGPKGRVQGARKTKIIFFSPSGRQLTNSLADSFRAYTDVILICGRYEGVDARVKKAFPMTDVSVGPYTLTGGELPAMILIDAVTRRIPGVLGHDSSVEERRTASPDAYTRPETVRFRGKAYRVPKVLLTGHHGRIDEWRAKRGGKSR